MPDKKVKFTKWAIGLIFILSFGLNNIWQGGENLWAYWISRFLIGGELAVIGLAFLFYPYFMLKVCGNNDEDLSDIPKWKFSVIGLIAGIPTSVFGIYFFSIGIKRWLITGCYFFDCLLSAP